MSKIEINECVYKIHPVYNLYAANEAGEVIHIMKKVPLLSNKKHNGYMTCAVRKYTQKGYNAYSVHRFVWECHNGLILDGKVIDHINNVKNDNRLCNLQLLAQQENCKKSAKDRDYAFVAKNHQNKRCVKATNCNTNEVLYFNSMYAVQQYLGINVGIVKMVCEGLNNCKTGISKKDNKHYKFVYVKKEDMPDNYIKSANIRQQRVSDCDKKKHQMEAMKKWQNKEYKCPRCGIVIKNMSKYAHNKKCE